MSCIVQISDTHFGTERAPVVRALTDFVRELTPELVILSGDITQRATTGQFEAARAFTDGLDAPILVIPGNHDIPLFDLGARLFHPYARYRQAYGEDLEPEHTSIGWLVLGVNTTRRWRHENGEVSYAQIDRVAQRLGSASPEQVRLVVVHQPMAVQLRSDERNLLRGRGQAVRIWAAAGMDAVLGGHIHLPYVQPLHAVHPELSRRAWCVQAGTAVSTRVRANTGNSVNVMRRRVSVSGRELVVERWDHVEVNARFEQVACDVLALDSGRAHG